MTSHIVDDAVREVARLQAINAELLAALKDATALIHGDWCSDLDHAEPCRRLTAAIAIAEGRRETGTI